MEAYRTHGHKAAKINPLMPNEPLMDKVPEISILTGSLPATLSTSGRHCFGILGWSLSCHLKLEIWSRKINWHCPWWHRRVRLVCDSSCRFEALWKSGGQDRGGGCVLGGHLLREDLCGDQSATEPGGECVAHWSFWGAQEGKLYCWREEAAGKTHAGITGTRASTAHIHPYIHPSR